VTLLPLHNPIKIAEEAATADILSDGRLEFGVGRGVAYQYRGFGIPQEESRERFEEALDFMLQAWSNESFSFEGKHFRARDLSIVPRPVQSPHPPVRVAANSPDTFPFSGRRQLPIFASPLINPPDKLKAGLAVYHDTLPTGTAGDIALAFPVHVAASRTQARQDCEAGLLRFLREATALNRPLGEGDIKGFEAFREVLARLERVKYEDFDREIGIFGDPDYCVDRVQELRREYGMDELICYFNQGGIMDHGMVKNSMTLFAKEVMPHCR